MIDRKKVMLCTILLASSYFLLSLSVTSNFLIALGCCAFISPFLYVTLQDLARVAKMLMDRLTDYESLNLLASKLLSFFLDGKRNIPSILKDVYKSSDYKLRSSLRMKRAVRKALYQRVFKCKRLHDQEVKFSSPTTKFLFSLIGKLDFIDEPSLRAFLALLQRSSLSLLINAKKLKDFITAEKVKFKVLQIASSMTLGFMIKVSFVFMKFSSLSVLPGLFALASFASLSIVFFIIFPSIIHLRFPSLKELVFCLLIFVTFMILPLYGGA